MSIFRRSFAAFAGLLLMQLTLLGSGTLCRVDRGVAQNEPAVHAVHGIEMAAMSGMNPDDCGRPVGHDGCKLPGAPGQCSSMTTCGVSPAIPATVGPSMTARIATVARPSLMLAEPGPTLAPELPPPRA